MNDDGINILLPKAAHSIRCQYCNEKFLVSSLVKTGGAGVTWLSRRNTIMTSCPTCRKPLPRCSICQLHLGIAFNILYFIFYIIHDGLFFLFRYDKSIY